MTPLQIQLVKSSWEKVIPIQDMAAKLFYDKLFTQDPSTRALFKSDMQEQGKMLMQTITIVVRALDNLGPLMPTIEKLAQRHVGYGVTPKHYDSVGQALIETLQAGLGTQFSPDVKEAWIAAYTTLSQAMIQAAYPDLKNTAS